AVLPLHSRLLLVSSLRSSARDLDGCERLSWPAEVGTMTKKARNGTINVAPRMIPSLMEPNMVRELTGAGQPITVQFGFVNLRRAPADRSKRPRKRRATPPHITDLSPGRPDPAWDTPG